MEGLSRTDREYAGDFGTPEQQIPANGIPGVDWESCMTMNDTWGFKSYDDELEVDRDARAQPDRHRVEGRQLSAERRARRPKARFPRPSVERLAAVGKWMAVNGESIYGTTASPFSEQLSFGRATKKGGRLYVQVFDWPANGTLTLPSWGATPKKAWLLATKADVPLKADASGVTLTLPAHAPDAIATVIAIE